MLQGKLRSWCFGAATFLALTMSSAVSQEGSSPRCGAPLSLDDGWTIASPENVGMDGTRLCTIEDRIKLAGSSLHGIVIARHGKLVFEQYFSGIDQPWGKQQGPYDFDAASLHDMRSVSKSVISLLIGIAIDRKLIAGPDEPVLKFFGEYQDLKTAGWDDITLRHFLTMSSGVAWDETRGWADPKNDEPHLGSDKDPIAYVLSKTIVAPPDTIWIYNGGGTDLLGTVLERATGKPLAAFADEVLFRPLGIRNFEWKTYPRNGRISAAAGLRLRPRDAAKIGQLVLDHGTWKETQIVPSAWVAQSITPRFQAAGYFGGTLFYGYQWWLGRSLAAGQEVKWIGAMGWGGQRIFIVPDHDLVVMITAAQYGEPKEGLAAQDLLANIIIPSVTDPH